MELEICCFGLESALAAQAAGADRIELCSGRLEGGTSPSLGLVQMARRKLDMEIFPIVRPRGGDFLFTALEIEEMEADIKLYGEAGCDGVVIGALTRDGDIDIAACTTLIEAAGSMSVSFHRAFDMCRDPQSALEALIDLGICRLLTSGQQQTAEAGIPLLRQLVEQADDRIEIMAGAGVSPANARTIIEATSVDALHASASRTIESQMTYHNLDVAMNKDNPGTEYQRKVSDERVIRHLRKLVDLADI